ncbi:MAG: PSD1 and planctomycete cytochrome C domain-containing protein [Planctomycetota bacterium]|nr:PSD1 and planctomycete cytochrome C domain-containing protein [Planctomycetota bacterium]
MSLHHSAAMNFLIVCIAITLNSVHLNFIAAEESTSPPDHTQQVEYFESQVRPIFARRCYECHSSDTGAKNGALVLETAEGIAEGGSRGVMFSPDDTHTGLLIRALNYTDEDLQMPPDGKLPDADLAVLQQWIQGGAALPVYQAKPRPGHAKVDFDAGRRFWSFQPLARPSLPDVHDAWIRSPIDAFVLQQLNAHQMVGSPDADRVIWLRRVTFDAIGLPPTLDEQQAFLIDQSPDAFESVVDRLLASPHFGERWARMWLDLARYTDFTPDWQSPTDRGWMYRDWVVRAMNENRPFDEFLRLQLAADLIAEMPPEDLAALGFLGLSPTYWKELKLAPSVIEQIVADEWDERIDAVSRTLLGLTVSCARCHDHKFDPISTEDYYGLAGVFASTQLDERPLVSGDKVASIKAARKSIDEFEVRLKKVTDQQSPEAAEIRASIEQIRVTTPDVAKPWAHVLREASLFVMPEGEDGTRLEYREAESRDLPVFQRGNPSNPGAVIPRRYLTVLQPETALPFQHGSGRLELADSMLQHSSGLIARVIVNRLWQQHFGAGLVRTTSDFGTQGDRPTHPELLEYLACEFVAHDWDLKWLHREVLLSSTYRQSSAFREDAANIDPANEFLWRMNRRRLDIEMWRDAMLAATGKLNPETGGPSQPVEDLTNVRRTIYARIEREEMNTFLRMHDFPEASSHSPKREPTTTPLQQLFVLNSAWIKQQADDLWQRLKSIESADERIDVCYQLLFSRNVTVRERDLARAYLDDDQSDAVWELYLQALLGLNEFHFVD